MFDADLRRIKDQLGEPLAARWTGLSPNVVSVVAFGVGLLTALLAAWGLFGWALGVWVLSRLLDGLDGLLARRHGKQSDFGGYLDILLDFGVYAAVPLGIVLFAPTAERYLALSFMLAMFYVNSASWMYLAALLEKRRRPCVVDPAAPSRMTSIVMPSGLIGGAESLIAYGVFLLWPGQVALLFTGFAALVAVTILQRLVWAGRNLL